MSEAGNGAMDSLILEGLKRAAAGLPRNGRPVSELDRLLAQGALISRLAKPKGGGSLFSLVNGLYAEAMFADPALSGSLVGMMAQAEAAFFATVMSEIVSGELIVREPLNMLRCNGIAEIQGLANATQGLESMAVLVRFVVKNEEAKVWLIKHGREIPDWLAGVDSESWAGTWSTNPCFKSNQRRGQVDILEAMINKMGFHPLCVREKGKGLLKEACLAGHAANFTSDGFDNCWKALVQANFVRTENHDICSGKAGKAGKKR